MGKDVSSIDFSQYLEEPDAEGSDKLKQLSALATKHRLLEAEIAVATAALKKKTDSLTEIAERKIPALMEELRLKRLDLAGGGKFVLEDEVHANISEARGPEAYEWLDDNGHGSIIKTRVVRAFNRDERDAATEFKAKLEAEGHAVAIENKVESATLKKFARERLAEEREALEAGEKLPDFPRELFGVFTKKVAKFKK